MNNSRNLVKALVPAVNNSFGSLKIAINDTIDQVTNIVDFGALDTTGVSPNLTLLANEMDVTQTGIQNLISLGNSMQTGKNNILALSTEILTGMNFMNSCRYIHHTLYRC